MPFYNFLNLTINNSQVISPYLFKTNNKLWDNNKLSNLLKQYTLKYLDEPLTINPYRQLINYIIKNRLNINNDSDSNDLIEDIQGNHSTKVSLAHYSRERNIESNSNINIIKNTIEFNIKFFKYFEIFTTFINKKTTKHIRNTSSINSAYKKLKLINNKVIINRALINNPITNANKPLILYLQELFKDNNAKFKSQEQENVIQGIINKTPFITYINGTNSGKSLLFNLSAFIRLNTKHFIISPRISLKEDLFLNTSKLGLNSEIWNKETNITTNLIFLSIKDLNNEEFQAYIIDLISNKQEFLFYFNEAYLIVLEEDFRYILKFIPYILKYKTNIVLISATLPNILLNLLEEKFNISSINHIIRGNTTRSNINYNIQFLNDKDNLINKLQELFNLLKSKLINNQKIIIFASTIESVKYISKTLNIPCYYSKLENKEEILNDFKNNNNTIALVASPAASVSINIPLIIYSIHLYKLYGLI